ncbi:hypothetical protein Tco_0888587 [Tanacetum coccineum]
MSYGSYPHFTVVVKGQKVTIKFQIPPTCEIALLISNIVANLGVKVEERATCSDMALRAWDSGVAWQLTLNRPVVKREVVQDKGSSDSNDGDFCEMEFIKQGSFTAEELESLVFVLKLAGSGHNRIVDRRRETAPTPSMDKSITGLEGMRVKIYGLKETKIEDSKSEIAWEHIDGYTQQKRDVEDTILLALQSPEVYDEIARGTRCKFETNRPRAVLFEGPPDEAGVQYVMEHRLKSVSSNDIQLVLIYLNPIADVSSNDWVFQHGTGYAGRTRVVLLSWVSLFLSLPKILFLAAFLLLLSFWYVMSDV